MSKNNILIKICIGIFSLICYGIWGKLLDSIFYNIPINDDAMNVYEGIKYPFLNNIYISLSGIGTLFCTILINNINNTERFRQRNIPRYIRFYMFLIVCTNFYITSLCVEKLFHQSFTGSSTRMFFPIMLRIFPVWLYVKYMLSHVDTYLN